MIPYVNPNPRLAVFLSCAGASVRLSNTLTRTQFRFGRWTWGGYRVRGLQRFLKDWPRARLLREWPGFGPVLADEFARLLAVKRPMTAALWCGRDCR